jgi:hypothetical protein
LDAAKRSNGGSYSYKLVEAIKLMGKLIPFLCTFILYWAVYSQTKTSFQAQSCQSNLSLGSIQVPVSSLNIFNNLTILALVPLFERCFYPFLKRQGLSLSMQQKILIGFGFALVAMLVSGVADSSQCMLISQIFPRYGAIANCLLKHKKRSEDNSSNALAIACDSLMARLVRHEDDFVLHTAVLLGCLAPSLDCTLQFLGYDGTLLLALGQMRGFLERHLGGRMHKRLLGVCRPHCALIRHVD